MRQTVGFDSLGLSLGRVYDALGYGGAVPGDDVAESVAEVMAHIGAIARPCFYFEQFEGELARDGLTVGGVVFGVGRIIAAQMKDSQRFALFAATAGTEFNDYLEELKRKGDMLELYIADSIGSIVAERTADRMEEALSQAIAPEGLRHTNRFSPGYCGWDVGQQQQLFGLLPPAVCGIILTESSLMIPIKSVSGVIGIGRDVSHKEYACNLCGYKNCYKRNREKGV